MENPNLNRYLKSGGRGAVFLASIMLICFVCGGCAKNNTPSNSKLETGKEYRASVRAVDDLGIEVIAIRLTAAAHMLDLRYRVVDPDKAMPLFKEQIENYLIDESSGKSLAVPVPAKVGPMRQTSGNPQKGKVYFTFFGNPNNLVKSGSKVTVVVGDYRIEGLTVE